MVTQYHREAVDDGTFISALRSLLSWYWSDKAEEEEKNLVIALR